MKIQTYIKPVVLVILALGLLTICVMTIHAGESVNAPVTAAQKHQVTQDVWRFT